MRFDEDMTAAEWAAQEARDAAEDMVRFERDHRFREDEQCIRWGAGLDRCVLAHDHLGPCQDASGETTLTLTARALRPDGVKA